MSTHCLVFVKEGNRNSKTLLCLYRQYDGYPSGIGNDIKKVFAEMKIINGFSEHKAPYFANGIGCFAAQLVKELKDGIGNVYIQSPDSNKNEQEYTYIFYTQDETQKIGQGYNKNYFNLFLEVKSQGKVLYKGLLKDFEPDNCG